MMRIVHKNIAAFLTLSLAYMLGGAPASPAFSAERARASYQPQYDNNPQYNNPQDSAPPDDGSYQAYSPDQLDNLLAPVALYPDPLLAQVLVAATFPDQIAGAAEWVQRNGNNPNGIDYQPWDVSVKAVAHYPTVLYMMNDKLDWTTALGQAYVNQSTDTMASVQHLRSLANAEGNLVSTPQQQVIVQGPYIQIVPAQPRVIYVPTYDPGVIYARRVYGPSGWGAYLSFGSGFTIGAWLNYDLDWGSRRVVYDGWSGGGWRARSRPYVQINNVYVNNIYRNVTINRAVVNRPVNYRNVNQFNSVHRNVTYDNRARTNAGNARPNSTGYRGPQTQAPPAAAGNPRYRTPGDAPNNPNRSNPAANSGYRGRDNQPAPSAQPAPGNRATTNTYRGQNQNPNPPPAASPNPRYQQPNTERGNPAGNPGSTYRGRQEQAPASAPTSPRASAPPPRAEPAPRTAPAPAPAARPAERPAGGGGNERQQHQGHEDRGDRKDGDKH